MFFGDHNVLSKDDLKKINSFKKSDHLIKVEYKLGSNEEGICAVDVKVIDMKEKEHQNVEFDRAFDDVFNSIKGHNGMVLSSSMGTALSRKYGSTDGWRKEINYMKLSSYLKKYRSDKYESIDDDEDPITGKHRWIKRVGG